MSHTQVLAKYWEGWSKCQGHPTVCFQFSDESICGELAFHEGEGWQISLAGTGKVRDWTDAGSLELSCDLPLLLCDPVYRMMMSYIKGTGMLVNVLPALQ